MSESRGGIDWKALSVDKGIDAFLIPLGLFAALWFQGWVDEGKERKDYAALIGDFTTEVNQNLGKVSALEVYLGPMSATEPDQALGPLQAKFDNLKAETERLSTVFECVDLHFDVSIKDPAFLAAISKATPAPTIAAALPAPDGAEPAPDGAEPTPVAGAPVEAAPVEAEPALKLSPEKQALKEELEACDKVLEDADNGKLERLPAIDLSPFYQYVVWQVYLSNGIKLFKDQQAKSLGLKLGEVYAAQREVEKRLSDIETLFNDTLMKSSGQLAALVSESAELLPDDAETDDLKEAQPRIQEMSQEAWDIRYGIDNIKSVVALKVVRLKTYVLKMNAALAEVKSMLEAETQRVGTGK